MDNIVHLTKTELENGLERILQAPKDDGTVELIVTRPGVNDRKIADQVELDLEQGVVGDNWKTRGYAKTEDGSAHPGMQVTIMNSRVAALVAQSNNRWALAGDQFFVDMDLSEQNLPRGSRIAIGSAELEVSFEPHLGCKKFVERFGLEAMKFVNSPKGKQLKLRGINARVVKPGKVKQGDLLRKLKG
jgi:MOSC domain-containing protein YiiM